MNTFETRYQAYRVLFEEKLRSFCDALRVKPDVLAESMRYSLLSGGKRLRPVLFFAALDLMGGVPEREGEFALALEMIHTYSLIHDDLPAMDNDDFRRGRPTNHKIYGEALAILAGDALLTDAFGVAATAKLPKAGDMATAIGVLSECAGSLGMVGGQVLDIGLGEILRLRFHRHPERRGCQPPVGPGFHGLLHRTVWDRS